MNIANDSLICQLQPCILRPEQIFAATRNGTFPYYLRPNKATEHQNRVTSQNLGRQL